MALIDDLNDVASASDAVSHLWVNSVASGINTLTTNLATANTNISNLQAARDEFKVTAGTGLTVNYLGGSVRLANGTYAVVAPGTIVVPASSTSFIFVNSSGAVATSTTRPLNCLEMAVVTTNSTVVTDVSLTPIRVASSQPRKIVEAVKSSVTNLNPDGISYGIPGWNAIVNEGSVFNGASGVLTIPGAWRIRVEASVNVSSPAATALGGKLSLYDGATELKIMDALSVPLPATTPSGMVLQGFYQTREDQTVGGVGNASIKLELQFRQGTSAQIAADNNTMLTVWRLS